MMQETNDPSHNRRLTVEQLLQVKRLEKPSPEFWLSFERELKEKQLQALVKPKRRQRLRAVWLPRLAVIGPIGGVAAIAVFVFSSAWIGIGGDSRFSEMDEEWIAAKKGEATLLAGSEALEESAPVARPRRVDSQFIVDALIPEKTTHEAFRTLAVPQTFLASTDGSAQYVMNVFTAGRRDSGGSIERATEF